MPTFLVVRWSSRPGVVLSALAIGALQIVGSYGAARDQLDRKDIDAVAVALLLLGPAALAVRDRWPLLAAAVVLAVTDLYLGLGYPYGPIFLSVILALFTAVQAGRRQVWAVAAAGFVGFVVAHVLDDRTTSSRIVPLTLVAGWLVGVIGVSELMRSTREQRVQRARAAQDKQRLQLAQELHDVLAHDIALINVQASVALHLLDEEPERARPALATIKETSRDALQQLRSALEVLRRGEAAPRAPAPGLAELDEMVAAVRATGLDVRIERCGEPSSVPAATEAAAYRIVQEALTNVTRHAGARSAIVRVEHGDGLTVEVVDDGVGGLVAPANGITGMRERAAALGGSVEAGPRPGGGFRVRAELPASAS